MPQQAPPGGPDSFCKHVHPLFIPTPGKAAQPNRVFVFYLVGVREGGLLGRSSVGFLYTVFMISGSEM